MAWVGTAVAAVGVVGSVVNGINAQNAADRMANASAAERARLEAEIAAFEKNRQAIINPYASFTNLSGLAKDLSGMISNPYANLGVATQAAKFEAEEIDLSLANTLDTLRETGSSAGGATALAMAALKSKQGISASIEQQEAQNEKLRAQGQQQLDQMRMAEAQRIQNLQITEAQRLQQAGAAGKQFMWESQEERDKAKLDRLAGLSDFSANQEAQANSDSMAAMTGMIGGITSSLAAGASAYAAGAGSSGAGEQVTSVQTPGLQPAGIAITSPLPIIRR